MKKVMYLFMVFGIFLSIICQSVKAEEIVLQPGPEDGMDVWVTSVYSDYGRDDYKLRVGGWADYYYSLIKFDLTELPSNVISAKIYLYSFDNGHSYRPSMYLDRVTSIWDEDTKWQDKPSYVNIDTLPAPTLYSWYIIDITELYSAWKDGTYEDYGIQLRPTSNNDDMNAFYSSDYMVDISLRPMLVVEVGSTTFQWPVDNPNITQSYACYNCIGNGKYHTGLDLTSSISSDTIYAADSGTVTRIDNETYPNENHCMGNVVIIDHNNGTFSLYAHLDTISVADGQYVIRGTQIGIMGNTGSGGGPNCTTFPDHLHFEVKVWDVLGNISDDGPQPPVYWGYTPEKPNWHGYINPYPYLEYSINNISSTPIRVTTNNQPVRTGPDPSYTQHFATVSSGQKFVAFSQYNGWYQVYIPSNLGPATGWIQGTMEASATLLEVNDPARGITGVRVRDNPSTAGNIISYVWDDQLLVKSNHAPSGNDCSKPWYEIYLPDGVSSLTGWVCGDYLTKELPDSPWPMFAHDLQHTSYATCSGPHNNTVRWSMPISSKSWGAPSPAIDIQGTIYIGSSDQNLYAINPDGAIRWAYKAGHVIRSSAAIGEDSTIYFGSNDGYLYALNPTGSLKWKYLTGGGVASSPAVIDGKIYFGSMDGNLYSLNEDGSLNWKFKTDWQIQGSSPAIDSNGIIYVGSYTEDYNGYLYAIHPDGSLKWKYEVGNYVPESPSIGNDGTIYICSNYLHAINPDGSFKWKVYMGTGCTPAIGADGTIYAFGSFGVTGKPSLTAINPDGTLKWRYPGEEWQDFKGTMALGSDGTIFVASGGSPSWEPYKAPGLFTIGTDGILKWKYEIHVGSCGSNFPKLAIGNDETLYGVFWDGKLYSFGTLLPDTYFISGQVSLGGTALSGVNCILSGDTSNYTSTISVGSYSFPGLPDGSYTITPILDGYTFNPASIAATISGADVSGQNFRACDTSVPLSGVLRDATTNTPLSGVTVTVDGVYSTVTDSNGYYEFSGLSCGDHEIKVDVPSGYSSYIRTMDTSEHQTWDILLTKPETVYGGETPSGYGPDPVNTATGNYIYQKKDFEIPGRGLSFVFNRYYNSQDSVDGPLGFGWGHTYNVKLTVNGDSTVTIRWADGKTETWTPDGSGGFTPQYGVFDDLIDNGDGTHTLKKKDLTEYGFDTSGRLSNIVDKNGNTVSMTYAGNNLTQITDTAGRNMDLAYDGNGRITQITDPIGRTVQFAYDVNGNLVSATDMNRNATTYTYDSYHQILTVVDPRGNTVVTNTYDDQKRVVTSQRDAKGGETTYVYDEVNKKTTITDALGYATIHFHDELLRLIQETDDKSNSAYFTYDEPGNRTEVKDKNGNTSTYTYDANGNVLTKTDALGNVTTITYDENNNPLTRTDGLGNTTTYEYDANGNLIKTTDPLGNVTTMTYNAHGQPLTITDARGNTTTNSYDAEGNLVEVTDALGNKTTYTYDGVGRRLTVTDTLGEITAYTYDNNNNLLILTDPLGNQTAHTYDENNNRLTTSDPMGNTTNYSYDVKDLLTTISDPLANSITNAYDGLDRKTSVTDKRGNTTTFSYDGVGSLLTITDPLDNSTTYTYDANGNQLTKTNPLGHTVTYAYDALDRVTSVTDPLGNSTTTIYDAIDKVTAETNAKGQTASFEYDPIGRLTKVTDDKEGTVICTYDENGNRLTMKEPNGNSTTYTYDALNRLTQKVEPLGGTHQYAYDAVGNMTSLTDANGNTITYTYDGNNRLTEIKYPDNSIVTFTYDANGNRMQMVDNLGTTGYAYDALNRMGSYTDPFGQTVAYGYDANGNRASLTYPDGKIVSYTYDAVNRLTTVTDWLITETIYTYDAAGNLVETLNPNNTKVTHTYNAAERLTGLSNTKSDSSVISSYTYTLDAVGNHTNVVQNEPLAPLLASQNIPYTYDAENRLLQAGGTTYSYDANGNLAGKGSYTFTYDYEDRLVQSNIEGTDTQYSYDGLGNRLAKSAGDANTRYVLDINGTLSNVLAETDNTGAVTAYYIYGLGLISKIFPDGTTYNYHYDSRGSTVALTDAVQNTTDAYAYDSFGNVINSNGSSENPFKYVGRYGVMVEGNGLSYIRARYYDPKVGRFITKDPQTGDDRDGQSLNRYVYALNNPVILIDISGFSAQEGNIQFNIFGSSDENHDSLIQTCEVSFATAGSTPQVVGQDDIGLVMTYDSRFYRWTNWVDIAEPLLRHLTSPRLVPEAAMAIASIPIIGEWVAPLYVTISTGAQIGFIISDWGILPF